MIQIITAHIKALRVHQWVKNGFVIAPLIFAGQLMNSVALLSSGLAFFGFSLCASSIYLLNDIMDYDRDQEHPKKRLRPIASGQVKRRTASILSLLLCVAGLFCAYQLNTATASALSIYVAMNIAYSLGMKHLFLIDLFFIAFGFILRVSVGAFAIQVQLSPWLLLCTLFVALFLGLCKRRHERSSLGTDAVKHRAILARYTIPFLDQLILLTASATVMSYALYTIDPLVCARLHTNGLLLTVPFVLFGVFRYLGLVYQEGQGGSPTQIVLKDRGIQVVIALYVLLCIGLIHTQAKLDLTSFPS